MNSKPKNYKELKKPALIKMLDEAGVPWTHIDKENFSDKSGSWFMVYLQTDYSVNTLTMLKLIKYGYTVWVVLCNGSLCLEVSREPEL